MKNYIQATIVVLVAIVVIPVVFYIVSSNSSNSGNSIPAPVLDNEVVEQKDIKVSFQTVKKVENKYRYFFDIRNNEAVPVRAEVTIELLKDNGSVLGKNTFTPTKDIEPGYGDSVYFDVNTGPVPYYDKEYAITQFRYTAEVDGKVVLEGVGKIE